jgi:hypothetical protein
MSAILSLMFISMIVSFFIFSIFSKTKNFRNECVSIGMLGTFTGITVSLFNFDSENISASIPLFLDGLKMAFITSGCGVMASILLSIRKPDIETSNMEQLIELQRQNNEIIGESLKNISTNVNDEIVNSLRKVVEDFNENLTSQFGENFKALNEAFFKLVIWQENYTKMIESQQQCVEKQHKVVISRLEDFEQLENRKLTNLKNNNDEMIGLIRKHVTELQQQTKEIQDLILGFSLNSESITKSLNVTVDLVNKRIEDSVKLAEDNITALIGVANGKLR